MIFFISDLHLSAQTPGITQLFVEFIRGRARASEHLYILGDLFEAWPGDDCIDDPDDSYNRSIVTELQTFTDSGGKVSVMHGNRDFLLGASFAERSGCTLIADPYLLSLPSGQVILSHGDFLCTDDVEYQHFRTQVRSPIWREAFLQKPLVERKAIVAALRQQSEVSKRAKQTQTNNPMDLNPRATDDFLREQGYATFIHGHTHHPAKHEHLIDGIHVERWVLSDWNDACGECLVWEEESLHRERLTA